MCLYPTLIKNPKYKANKKNGGNIPAVSDERVKYVPIGCQDCMECRNDKRREWQVRMMEDIKTNTNGKFVTLTFSNESIQRLVTDEKLINLTGYELDNAIATRAMRLFNERWRKKHKKALRHWMVTELGHNGTENIHLHGIIWTNESIEEIRNTWQYGWIWPRENDKGKNYVNAKTVNYIIKYISKIDEDHRYYKSVILTSPGIGGNYDKTYNAKLNKYKGDETKETYRTSTGHKIKMPIYWRNKIYSEEEREKLWLLKLDKQERWICGEKIDISKGEEAYYKSLKHYRELNTQLGYGNGEKDWKREIYERERRAMQQTKRLEQKKVTFSEEKIKLNPNEKYIEIGAWRKEFGLEDPEDIPDANAPG